MSIQTEGYKDNSPYKKRKRIKINSNNITMKGVSEPIMAIPDGDQPIIMLPNKDYIFPNSNTVMEYKMKKGGKHPIEEYIRNLSPKEQDEFVDYMDTLDESERQEYLAKLMEGGCAECGGYMKKSKKGNWIQHAVNPKHKGYCTPMSKPTCTGHRRAFALMMKKKHGFHKDGGEIYPETSRGMANVEVEDQETTLLPNGQLREFEGKTHAEGGIPTNLPAGSMIFSEYLKVPKEVVKQLTGRESKKPVSYADLSKKLSTKKFEDILKNPDSDQYEINTAQSKLATNNASLQTLFATQEAIKQKENKEKMQTGGSIGPEISILDQLRAFGNAPQDGQFPVYLNRNFVATDKNKHVQPAEVQPNYISAGFAAPNEDFSYPVIHTEPSPTVSTGVVLPPPPMSAEELAKRDYKQGPETFGEQRDYVPAISKTPKGISKKPVVTPKTLPARKPFPNFDQLGQVGWSPFMVTSERGAPKLPDSPTPETDGTSYPGDEQVVTEKSKKRFDFGISPKVTGTILDMLLAGSDRLNVVNPQYYDQRKYPLFSRFVESDDKEAERNLSLTIKQIQDSDMPEQVKQSRIADINAQYQDYKAKRDTSDAQRYQAKIEGDLNKLQAYSDRNIDQHRVDIEDYLQRKAKVDYLKDQFNAQRKSRLVNSARQFFDYVENTNMQNELSDNYRVNPWTGKVDFKGSKQDPLKQQEDLINQYQQNSSSRSLPNGATFTMLGPGVGVVTGPDGKSEIIKF